MYESRGLGALVVFLLWVTAVPGQAGPILINEFHYDNAGADAGEFIELAGIAGTSLTGWSVVFYNGADGAPYRQRSLSEIAPAIPDWGGTGFGFVSMAVTPIQNGVDAIALVHDGLVQEFLSYEGVFAATAGPALGLTSVDIGVSESGSTPLGASLQRVGSGYRAEDFSWQSIDSATRDRPNVGQSLVLPDPAAAPTPRPLPAGSGPAWWLALLWLVFAAGGRRRGRERSAGEQA